jgi:hypothetical protein
MRVVNKNAPTDVDKFWFTLGEMRVTDATKGQPTDEIIEVDANVAKALNAPGAEEAGRPAFLRGFNKKLDEAIAADALAMKNKRDYVSWVKTILAAYIQAMPAGAVTVRPEKRKLKRKVVEEFDAEGRILSMLEEEV